MAILENEWRKRERAREVEVAAVKSEYAALEERTRQVRPWLGDCTACVVMLVLNQLTRI